MNIKQEEILRYYQNILNPSKIELVIKNCGGSYIAQAEFDETVYNNQATGYGDTKKEAINNFWSEFFEETFIILKQTHISELIYMDGYLSGSWLFLETAYQGLIKMLEINKDFKIDFPVEQKSVSTFFGIYCLYREYLSFKEMCKCEVAYFCEYASVIDNDWFSQFLEVSIVPSICLHFEYSEPYYEMPECRNKHLVSTSIEYDKVKNKKVLQYLKF